MCVILRFSKFVGSFLNIYIFAVTDYDGISHPFPTDILKLRHIITILHYILGITVIVGVCPLI
jgi:hypothetical protein